jgi:hypothetical protein
MKIKESELPNYCIAFGIIAIIICFFTKEDKLNFFLGGIACIAGGILLGHFNKITK